MERVNIHATAVVVGRAGLLIVGPSGSGKSRLALALVDFCRARSVFATLVADDQVWIRVQGGRLIAEAPGPIAGLVEIRGYGPAPAACEARAVVDRVVALVDPPAAPRHREEAFETLLGVALPRIELAARDAAGAARAVAAWLENAVEA